MYLFCIPYIILCTHAHLFRTVGKLDATCSKYAMLFINRTSEMCQSAVACLSFVLLLLDGFVYVYAYSCSYASGEEAGQLRRLVKVDCLIGN